MGAQTLAPAGHAVFLGDAAADAEFVVAAGANVIVAGVAFEAVEAGGGGGDGVPADVAEGGEGQGAEDGVCDCKVTGAAGEGGGFGG